MVGVLDAGVGSGFALRSQTPTNPSRIAKPILTGLVAASLLTAGASAKPVRVAGVPAAVTASIPAMGTLVIGSTLHAHLLPRSAGLVTSFAFDPVDPDLVYAGTSLRRGRIYKSTDDGVHWRPSADLPASVTALASDPRRPGTLYAATGVPAWTWPNGVPTFQGWKHVAVYKTANGGRSWQRWSRGLQPPSFQGAPGADDLGRGWVTVLAVDPSDGDVVYAGTSGGIEKSTDGGRSWQTVLSGSKFLGTWGLAITPTHPQVVYAAALIDTPGRCSVPTSGARIVSRCDQTTLFYKSVDSGKTWRATDLRQVGLDGPVVLDAHRPRALYSAAGFGVYRNGPDSDKGIFETTDGGHNWTRLDPACPITALAVDPARTSTIYAGIYRGHGPYYRIIKSTDSGRTWTVIG